MRRTQILDAAIIVIAERGVSDARVTDIARRAGTSAGLVLYYFESKERLLAEALAYAEDRFTQQTFRNIQDSDDARDKLVGLIDASCPATVGAHPDSEWSLWLELWAKALRDADVARMRQAMDRRWRQAIADIVREGQQAGVFCDAEPLAFAVELSALMDGLAIQVVLEDPDVTVEQMKMLCIRLASERLGFDFALEGSGPIKR